MSAYEFDPLKNAANRSKHGIDLAEAEEFEWATALIGQDCRRDYGEVRYCAFGLIGERLFSLVFTPRGNAVRIISLRKANAREVRRYVRETQSRGARPE